MPLGSGCSIVRKTQPSSCYLVKHVSSSFALMHLRNFSICSLMCLSFSNISNGSQWTGPCNLQINKCTSMATIHTTYFINHCYSKPHTSDCFWNSYYVMSNNTTEFYFPWSWSSNSELGTHTLQQVAHESIQVYTAYNLYTVTPQPEGPNTVTNCTCTPCFYITACLKIVINVCSMPATRLLNGGWQANPTL